MHFLKGRLYGDVILQDYNAGVLTAGTEKEEAVLVSQ